MAAASKDRGGIVRLLLEKEKTVVVRLRLNIFTC